MTDDSKDAGGPDGPGVADDTEATGADASEATDAETVTRGTLAAAVEDRGRPAVTATDVARVAGVDHDTATESLRRLATEGAVERLATIEPPVWYPADWRRLARRERVVVFPERRQVVAHHPEQFTRAQLSQFARLVDATGDGAYLYEVREADVWAAPHDDVADLLATVRDATGGEAPALEDWIADRWERANRFVLRTHEDGYVVLEGEGASLMGNVAREKLPDDALRGPISDTESWVARDRVATVKRVLYEAGYPVRDERDLETGADLDVELQVPLRDYQRGWVERFVEAGSGVLVGPPGSGKTVAAIGVVERVGGETLVLVPSRELAGQWREELLAHTDLAPDQVGEYHGGRKERRPVTIATYRIAGMDRHRELFDAREWGLVVFDEAHHVPSPVYRRSADLQAKHRLGLSATPVRGDDREEDIFTLVGPPVGTDWDALFDAGFVAEPSVEIRYVPWDDEGARGAWQSADGHERRRLAATNPAKVPEVRRLLAAHPGRKALVFVDYLDQGEAIAEALSVPFVSGETPRARRRRLLQAFRDGERETLVVSRVGDEGIDLPGAEVAVVASGLGGSRRQGAQRAGRTMRPEGTAEVYVLATRGTSEEEFARQRTRHLAEKGVRVTEHYVGDGS